MTEQSNPATRVAAVTPSDTANLSTPSRALYIGTAGDVAVIPAGQTTPVTFVGVLAGSIIPVRVSRVLATGTTADDILSLS